jgi:hypothetical protein
MSQRTVDNQKDPVTRDAFEYECDISVAAAPIAESMKLIAESMNLSIFLN